MAVNIIRICGALLIFLCHACNESGTALGGILGQVFNIGVPIFFVLSGYLHSMKSIPNSVGTWYWKKAKRIMVPLYIFLGILAIIYLVTGHKINLIVWLQTIIPICGITQNYISGCGHLWFITHLLICYAITPLLQKYKSLTKKTNSACYCNMVCGLQPTCIYDSCDLVYIVKFTYELCRRFLCITAYFA